MKQSTRFHRYFWILLAACLGLANTADADTPIAGTWSGQLHAGGVAITIAVHISVDASGALSATMDSPNQGAYGLGTADVTFEEGVLSFRVPIVGGNYEGTLSEDGTEIDGVWHQSGQSLELKLTPGEEQGPNRPQTPQPPFPYDAEDVAFENHDAGITLAGTLTIPHGDGPFPAVVMITGSGPQDRDETLMSHRPFLVIADRLSRNGIAVLRYDDRGVGMSGGDFNAATTVDFGTDAAAAVDFLVTRSEINHDAIGLIGHSEGGMVAPRVANASDHVSFVVTLAGVAVPGYDLMLEQTRHVAAGSGLTSTLVDELVKYNGELYKIACDVDNKVPLAERVKKRLGEIREELGAVRSSMVGFGENRDDAIVKMLDTDWFRGFVQFDPGPDLESLKVPLLAIFGDLDVQVPPAQNAPAIEKADPKAEVVVYPGLNHLLQHAKTGMVAEYGEIEETISPEVLDKLTSWIQATTGR